MIRILVYAAAALASGVALASSPFKQSLNIKKNNYLTDGVFIGGKASGGSSLLGIRRAFSAKAELERVIMDIGDGRGKPAGKRMGYFQASVDSGQNRVVVDLAQLHLSKINEQQVRDLFKSSPYVASVDLTLDPQDSAGTMVLNLKRPMKLEVFELLDSRKPGRIVLDLTPAPVASSRVSKGNGALGAKGSSAVKSMAGAKSTSSVKSR